MKSLIFLALFLPILSFGQKKHSNPIYIITSPPHRDSSWDDKLCDTIWGIVEMEVGNGVMRARGFMETCSSCTYTKYIFLDKDRARIDSIDRASGNYKYDKVQLWPIDFNIYYTSEKGSRRPERKFIFIPNQKP